MLTIYLSSTPKNNIHKTPTYIWHEQKIENKWVSDKKNSLVNLPIHRLSETLGETLITK